MRIAGRVGCRTRSRSSTRTGSRAGTEDRSWPRGLASALIARAPFVKPNGQRAAERRPLTHVALDPDPPPMQLHELLGQRQSEPRALLLAGVLAPHLAELLEDGRLILGRDADPSVADGDGDGGLGLCGGAP